MKILITGSKGFIGKNLIAELKNRGYIDLYEYDTDTDPARLDIYCKDAAFVFHLAGINRPQNQEEFMTGNAGFSSVLLETLKRHGNSCPVLVSSSIQAELDNPYGRSKKASEDIFFTYAKESNTSVFVFRLPNVFGKWCRPNYNSAIATFCHNIAHGLPISVDDRETVIKIAYIDDVAGEFIDALRETPNRNGVFCAVKEVRSVKLGQIADWLNGFSKNRDTLYIPDISDPFVKKLYSTYMSYLPEDGFDYPLTAHTDSRGSFTEFLRSEGGGQISVNISKPGVVKGNHWHHTKIEKFLVVSGEGVIRFRQLSGEKVLEYHADAKQPRVIDVPPGYTHNIENTGEADMVALIWANECFDPNRPDTYPLEV